MLTFIAREVNQPLTAIIANAQACARLVAPLKPGRAGLSKESLGEARAALEDIARHGRRPADVVGKIRGQFGHALFDLQPVDMNRLVREVLALAELELTRQGVVARTELHPDLPLVPANELGLQSAVYNLIVKLIGAFETAPNGSQILTIQSRLQDGGHVAVVIGHSGSRGIGVAALKQIVNGLSTIRPEPADIGLWASKSIIQRHGGSISAIPGSARMAIRITVPAAAVTG